MYVFKIFNREITFGTSKEIISIIENLVKNNNSLYPNQVITLNSLIYLNTKFNKEALQSLKKASLVICDSFGVAVVCSLFSLRILRHQPGIELIEEIAKISKQKEYKIFLLGSKEEIVKETAERLKKIYEANIVGEHHGYFLKTQLEQKQVIDSLNQTEPDILFVGLPTEIQESWIYRNLKNLKCKLVIGVGGSFDVISGKLKRAPKLFIMFGLEWFFRLVQEPWRIKRILKLPLAFAVLFYDCLISKLKRYKNA